VTHCASVVQVAGHAAPEPSQTKGVQLGAPEDPSATVAQVPFVVAPAVIEQASQAPAQALSQQTVSAQWAVRH
jgi:hypothetical protein